MGNGATFGSTTHFGDLVNFFHVAPARLGEEHQRIMGTGCEQVFNEIILISRHLRFMSAHPDYASSATPLRPEFTFGGPFEVAAMGNSNDASLVGNEVLDIDFALVGENLSEPFGSVFILYAPEFFLD